MITKKDCRNLWINMISLAACLVLVAHTGSVNAESAATESAATESTDAESTDAESTAAVGAPGTFCESHEDCVNDACCIIDPSISPSKTICKLALDEHEICGPFTIFRTQYKSGIASHSCGPCKQGLACKPIGNFGVHQVCMNPKSSF